MSDDIYSKIIEFEKLLETCPSLLGIIFVPENKILAMLSNIYDAMPQELKANKDALAEKLGDKNVYYILYALEQYIRSACTALSIKAVQRIVINKYLDAMYAAMPDNMKTVIEIVRGIEKTNDRIG